MGSDAQASDNGFLEETRAYWERRLGRPVSLEDAREMVANVTAYFRLLQKWDTAARQAAAQGSRRVQPPGQDLEERNSP